MLVVLFPLLIIAVGIFGFYATAAALDESGKTAAGVGAGFLATLVALIVWLVVACNADPKIVSVHDYPVEVVAFADGSQHALYSWGPGQHDFVRIASGIPPTGALLRKTVRSRWYYGIYFQDYRAEDWTLVVPPAVESR